MRVQLVPYDPTWPARYAEHERRIRAALGELALLIEHVGSTSVPGLAAKPIIDVLVLVADPADEAAYVPALEAAGYLVRLREPDFEEHRLLQPAEGGANVHVHGPGAADATQLRVLRDRLRSHPEERAAYEAVKRDLAARDWPTVQDYADAKTEIVLAILERAGVSARPARRRR